VKKPCEGYLKCAFFPSANLRKADLAGSAPGTRLGYSQDKGGIMIKTWVKLVLLTTFIAFVLNSCVAFQPIELTPTIAPTPTSTPTPPYKMLLPEDMRFDLNELFRQIEKNHPDPYAKRSKEDVDRDRQALDQELSQPMTMVDFYRKVAPLIDSLGDSHTVVFPSSDTIQQIDSYEKVFPLDVEFERGKAYIIKNYTDNPDIPLGAELLSINGTPLSTIQNKLIIKARFSFDWKLWLLNGSSSEYQMALLPNGESTSMSFTVPGLTYDEIDKQNAASQTREEVTYRTLPNEKIGILTLNDFMSIYEPVKQAFSQIQEDGVQNLIIDIRENGGGHSESLDLFMNYLTDQPYQKCYKCAFNRPWDNVSNRYHGKTYLLIGPDTYSAAVLLATILQDHQLATLVGEETAETSSFCGYVVIGGEPLPRTKLRYMCSRQCLIRPNGIVDDRGVIPDTIVKTTIADQLAGNDPVLDYTLEIIRKEEIAP
jgi:hypothetical protein